MRTLFFCARDIRDYLKGIIDTRELENTPGFEATLPALTDTPEIQKFLFEFMSVYECRDEACAAPICGETGIDGLRLDFNFGLRLEVPAGNFHVTIGDFDGEQIFFDRDLSDVRLISVEKYFIRWSVEISRDGQKIFSHVLDLSGQRVIIAGRKFAALGDTLTMLPTVADFRRQHRCDAAICLSEYLREFAAHLYPDLPQVDAVTFDSYATYFLSMYGGSFPFATVDLRNTPLSHVAGAILGVNTLPPKPTFKPMMPRQIAEPYVCIAVQASTPIKGWHYPHGWEIVVEYLKRLGYRIFCIDRENFQRDGQYTEQCPANAEDFTGDFTIMERANMLYHADFFIGLGSGLAWLAEAVNCPVVMICGFSQDWYEFYTPYRVANRLVCNGCFNDVHVCFMYDICPYQHDTPREFECQKKITPQQVLSAIEQLIVERGLTPPIGVDGSR